MTPQVVFRASVRHGDVGPAPLWRGIALDTFDGQRWQSTFKPVSTTMQPPSRRPSGAVVLDVTREPVPRGILFVPGRPVNLVTASGVLRSDGQGSWFGDTDDVDRYTVMSLPPFGVQPTGDPDPQTGDAEIQRALHLPPQLRPRMEALAARVAGEGPARTQVDRLVAYLRDNHAYTRRPSAAPAQVDVSDSPLASFLLEKRAGHCEYFASALAVLARSRGIPARVINGFAGGEHDGAGTWVVRRHHAHSWVEVYLQGQGWQPVDATPEARIPLEPPVWTVRVQERIDAWWRDAFLPYDGRTQRKAVVAAMRRVEAFPVPKLQRAPVLGALVLFVGLSAGGGLLGMVMQWLWMRRAPGAPGVGRVTGGPVARAHLAARRHLERRGVRFPGHLPPVAAAQWWHGQAPGPQAEALIALAWLYYDVALGGADPRPHARRAQALLREVTRAP